jgi:diaminopimelate decarboxylase
MAESDAPDGAHPAPPDRSQPSPWPANAAFDDHGLTLAGIPAETLVRDHRTPLYVIDEDDLRARCRAFASAFPHVHYAVKALTVRAVLRIVAEEGLGFLVASGGELEACLRAGLDPATICFHGNNKSDEELELAVASRVGVVIADNAEELRRLDGVVAMQAGTQGVMLRLQPGVAGDTHDYLETGGMGSKFGTPIEGGEALDAVKLADSLPHLEFLGVHAHVGSQLLRPDPYFHEIEVLFDFLAELHSDAEIAVDRVDIGGGFGVTYTDEDPLDTAGLAGEIRARVRENAERRGLAVPHLMIEPGRSLVANPVVTLYTVGAVKLGDTSFVAVDGGMSDNIRPALYGARYTVASASPRRDVRSARFTLVGKHCETGDTIAEGVELPADVRRGDIVALASTGAYGYSMASNYNKVGRPAVVAVRAGVSRAVVRREDAADLDRLNVDVPPLPPIAPPPGIEIRPARADDADSFHTCWSQIVSEGWVRSTEVRFPPEHYAERFRDPWNEEFAHVLAVSAGEVLGHLNVSRQEHPATRHSAEIGMGVRADHRGQGVGSALMAEAFRWASEMGVERLKLAVYPDNVTAIRLYRRFGFVDEGRLIGESKRSSVYRDEILMARWVP